jgi:chorismate mutase/prephenate dehydratase
MSNTENIQELRLEIDKIDENLAKLFQNRMKLVEKISLLKQNIGLQVYDKNRENYIITKASENVSPQFKDYVKNFFIFLLETSRKYQNNQIKKCNNSQKR